MYFKLGQPPDQIVIPFGVLKAEIWNQIHLLKLNPGKGPRLRVFYTYFKKHAHATLIMPFVRTVNGGDAAYFGYAFTQYTFARVFKKLRLNFLVVCSCAPRRWLRTRRS